MSTVQCPSTVTSEATCNSNPNSVWRNGACVCCATDGTSFVNTANGTCVACTSTQGCSGYCKSSAPNCVQNVTTKTWSTGTLCQNGSCGLSEFFLFNKCSNTTSPPTCQFDITQVWSWLVYIGFLILIVLFGILIWWLLRSPTKKEEAGKPTVITTATPQIPASMTKTT